MTKTVEQLLQERAAIDAEIAKIQAEARQTAFSEIQRIVANAGISTKELIQHFSTRGVVAEDKKRASPAPKYRDPVSGAVWSGRGKPPKYITSSGKDKSEFLIK